jgi:hypothetical protein
VLSSMPPFQLFFPLFFCCLLLPSLLQHLLPTSPTPSIYADTSYSPLWSQCRSTAQSHKAGEGSTKHSIDTHLLLLIKQTWFCMIVEIL